MKQFIGFISLVLLLSYCKNIHYTQEDLFQPDKVVRLADYPWIKEQYVAVSDSVQLHILYSEKDNGKPAVFYLHGNSGNMLSPATFERIKWFHRHGFQVISMDYRGYGKSSGQAHLSTLKQDVALVYDQIKALDIAREMIVYGFSLGTWPAINLSKKSDCPPLILEGTFVSPKAVGKARLKNLGIPLRWFVSFSVDSSINVIDTRQVAKSVECPTLLLHGKKDPAIPVKFAKEVHKLIPADKKQLKIYPDGKHGMAMSKMKSSILGFIEGL